MREMTIPEFVEYAKVAQPYWETVEADLLDKFKAYPDGGDHILCAGDRTFKNGVMIIEAIRVNRPKED